MKSSNKKVKDTKVVTTTNYFTSTLSYMDNDLLIEPDIHVFFNTLKDVDVEDMKYITTLTNSFILEESIIVFLRELYKSFISQSKILLKEKEDDLEYNEYKDKINLIKMMTNVMESRENVVMMLKHLVKNNDKEDINTKYLYLPFIMNYMRYSIITKVYYPYYSELSNEYNITTNQSYFKYLYYKISDLKHRIKNSLYEKKTLTLRRKKVYEKILTIPSEYDIFNLVEFMELYYIKYFLNPIFTKVIPNINKNLIKDISVLSETLNDKRKCNELITEIFEKIIRNDELEKMFDIEKIEFIYDLISNYFKSSLMLVEINKDKDIYTFFDMLDVLDEEYNKNITEEDLNNMEETEKDFIIHQDNNMRSLLNGLHTTLNSFYYKVDDILEFYTIDELRVLYQYIIYLKEHLTHVEYISNDGHKFKLKITLFNRTYLLEIIDFLNKKSEISLGMENLFNDFYNIKKKIETKEIEMLYSKNFKRKKDIIKNIKSILFTEFQSNLLNILDEIEYEINNGNDIEYIGDLLEVKEDIIKLREILLDKDFYRTFSLPLIFFLRLYPDKKFTLLDKFDLYRKSYSRVDNPYVFYDHSILILNKIYLRYSDLLDETNEKFEKMIKYHEEITERFIEDIKLKKEFDDEDEEMIIDDEINDYSLLPLDTMYEMLKFMTDKNEIDNLEKELINVKNKVNSILKMSGEKLNRIFETEELLKSFPIKTFSDIYKIYSQYYVLNNQYLRDKQFLNNITINIEPMLHPILITKYNKFSKQKESEVKLFYNEFISLDIFMDLMDTYMEYKNESEKVYNLMEQYKKGEITKDELKESGDMYSLMVIDDTFGKVSRMSRTIFTKHIYDFQKTSKFYVMII